MDDSISLIDFCEIKMYIPFASMEMSQNVIYLHGKPDPVAHYPRLGTLHRQIETLLGSGRMPLDRVVVEASAFSRQRDVITLLAESGQ